MSEKNTRKLAKRLNLPIAKVLVRGGTGHRKDLFLEDGRMIYLWADGTLDDAKEFDAKPFPVKDPSIPEECRA